MVLILLLAGWVSCDTQNGVDRSAVKKEMANRELKRLRISDLIKGAQELSTTYFAATDSLETKALRDSLDIQEEPIIMVQSTQEEKELFEAFFYAVQENLPLEDYVTESGESILVYHPIKVEDSLSLIRLKIPKKTIVKML